MDFTNKSTRRIVYLTLLTAIICTFIWGYVSVQRSNYNRYEYKANGVVFDNKTGTLLKVKNKIQE